MGTHIIQKIGLETDAGLQGRLNSNLNRRELISRSAAMAVSSSLLLSGSLLISGCARGSSSHAGRRGNLVDRSEIRAVPLQFDVNEAFSKLNKVRTKRLLPAFRQDNRLQKAASNYANLMGSRGLYGHEIGPGTDFKSRIFAVGYDNSSGENIGVGYDSIDKAIQGWLDSPPHKKNMLKPDYALAGFGYGFNTSGKNPRYTHYWVLIMGADDGRYS